MNRNLASFAIKSWKLLRTTSSFNIGCSTRLGQRFCSEASQKKLLFLTKTGCAACSPVLFVLRRLLASNPDLQKSFSLAVIDVAERKYSTKYGHLCQELPVILAAETELTRGKVHESVLLEKLKIAAKSQNLS